MKRKTKIMMMSVSSGVFASMAEATKEANAIKIWLQRLCDKKGYSCKAVIGVSEYNPKTGSMTVLNTGKRGRPRIVFTRTNFYLPTYKTSPHLHIVLYCCPADMICSLLANRLNNKYKAKIVWWNECQEYAEEAITYILKQSQTIRKVDTYQTGMLATDNMGFYTAISKANATLGMERIKFTLPEAPPGSETPDIVANLIQLAIQSLLQCNSNNIYNKYIKIVFNNIEIYQLRLKILKRYIPP